MQDLFIIWLMREPCARLILRIDKRYKNMESTIASNYILPENYICSERECQRQWRIFDPKELIWIEAELDVCTIGQWFLNGNRAVLPDHDFKYSGHRQGRIIVSCANEQCLVSQSLVSLFYFLSVKTGQLADTSLGFLVAGGGAGARSRSRGNLGSGDGDGGGDGGRNGGDGTDGNGGDGRGGGGGGGGGSGGALWASHFLECKKLPNMRRPRPDVDVGALLKSLANKQGRKYSLDSVKMSLEAILQQGVSTTQASEMYGINRSTLQFYLKKLNVVRRRWRQQPTNSTPVQPRHT